MAESGTPGERIAFRDPTTGRFTTRSAAIASGGLLETFAPGGGLTGRVQINVSSPGLQFERADGPHSTLITRLPESGDDWLLYVEPPFDRDVTEFRFVVEDEGYDSGFRTTSPFSADESPADVASRLGLGNTIVRVVYGVSQ